MSLVVAKGGSGDIDPFLICARCQETCLPHEAWLLFPPLDATVQQPVLAMHRACIQGQPQRRERLVQWRGDFFVRRLLRHDAHADVLTRLATEAEPRYRHYQRGSSSAYEHPLPVRLRRNDRDGTLDRERAGFELYQLKRMFGRPR